ncbi:MAG: IS4 family transposase, partial [Candidatus Omnitrophota bacterium]|nr:IS4 family transposase [Candidatus Omnitrophota bacterium]
KKQLTLKPDLYTILQILSISIFEKTPMAQVLTTINSVNKSTQSGKQLLLFNL